MGVEENIRLAGNLQDAYNARDWERFRGALADSVVVYDPAMPEPIRGPEAVLKMFRESAGFFPTSHVEGVHAFGQEDWVCIENVETGARKDSDKSYRIRTCYTFRVADEGISIIRTYYDALDMMAQIGMSTSEIDLGP